MQAALVVLAKERVKERAEATPVKEEREALLPAMARVVRDRPVAESEDQERVVRVVSVVESEVATTGGKLSVRASKCHPRDVILDISCTGEPADYKRETLLSSTFYI